MLLPIATLSEGVPVTFTPSAFVTHVNSRVLFTDSELYTPLGGGTMLKVGATPSISNEVIVGGVKKSATSLPLVSLMKALLRVIVPTGICTPSGSESPARTT